MTVQQFRLPDLGEGLPEAEIVAWLVEPGDTVALNQTIAEVETAKAVVELPSPYAGIVAELRADAGDTVAVGDVLIAFETEDPEPASDEAAEMPERAEPNLVGYGAAPRATGRPQRRPRAGTAPAHDDADVRAAAPHDAVADQAAEPAVERPRSTPPVRKLAKELGVDLALVAASGATGLITRGDVEAFAARTAAPSDTAASTTRPDDSAATVSGDRPESRHPIRGVRKATAEAMVRSAFTAPHATVFLTVDVTSTLELIAGLRDERRFAERRVGVLAVAAYAACRALPRHPELNSRWDADAAEIVQHHYVNLGIAAATDRGLIVPHIRDAERLDLLGLADAIGALAETARAGRTPLEALRGGTFSVTNFGVFGVDAGTPIINPGEAAILGVGAATRRPWEHRGEIALRDVLTLSLSVDHRIVDGQQASQFLAHVGDVLREPGRAMLLG